MPNTMMLSKEGREFYPITHEDCVVGLNARPYDSQSPNGMGYLVLENGKTFASQVTAANTIYEIRYDCALSANFTMPSGCVLKFNGGQIKGPYTLTGNNTKIDVGLENIFGTDILIAGSWDVKEWHPEWFGAKNDKTYNSTSAFQKCLDICKDGGLVKVSSGEFLLDTLYFKFGRNCHLEGSGTGATILRMHSAPLIAVEDYTDTPNTTDGSSYGNFSIRARDGQDETDPTNVCILHTRIRHGYIHDIDLLQGEAENSKVYAFLHIYGDFTYSTYIERIRCRFGSVKYGVKTTAKNNSVYSNANIVNMSDCQFWANTMEACVDMSCCTQYEIKGCLFESCGVHALILGQAGNISGNWIEDFSGQTIVFQNNLGTVTSSKNYIGENYITSDVDVHIPAYCEDNSIQDFSDIVGSGKFVKDTNTINVSGLRVSEPTITVNGYNTAVKSSAIERDGVWELKYVVNIPTGQGLSEGNIMGSINTTETANIKRISATACDIWDSLKQSPVAIDSSGTLIIHKTDDVNTMLVVYVEFC